MYKKSLIALAIGIITPLFSWVLLKSLANNSSSGHNPDPWIQSLVDQPQTFTKNASENGWFKINSANMELQWEKAPGESLPLVDIPQFTGQVVLVVDVRGPKAAHDLYEFMKTRELSSKALILSASDGLLKDMQYYDVNLLLSCGQAYLIRLRMLHQLGLANLMKTTMSAAWLDGALFQDDLEELASELLQRRVPVFIGPQLKASSSSSLPMNVLLP